jgi:Flp pilus assembly protein TadG
MRRVVNPRAPHPLTSCYAAPRRAGVGRRGSALVYLTATLVALLAFASLAIDVGRVLVVRSELQLAADAAARYGAKGLTSGVTTAQSFAVDAADDNLADGAAVVIDPGTDIEFLSWNPSARTYTTLTGTARANANALRVRARRTSANGGGVPLMFARVLGRSSFDVEARSIAYLNPSASARGIVGLTGIRFRHNAYIGGYNSASLRSPTRTTDSDTGNLSSNGSIRGSHGNQVRGDVLLGPSAPNVRGVSVSGATTRAGAAIPTPAEATWNPQANPNGISQNYRANGNVTLPGGTYYFTSLRIQGTLTFSGPATLIVRGPITMGGYYDGHDDDDDDHGHGRGKHDDDDDNGDHDDNDDDYNDDDDHHDWHGASLLAYDLVPANLVIKQIGRTTFGGRSNGIDIVADVEGPQATFYVRKNLKFRGRMLMRSIYAHSNAEMYYDNALGTASGGGLSIMTVR